MELTFCKAKMPSPSVYCLGAGSRLAATIPPVAADTAGHVQVDRPFLALVAAVAKLEALAARWLPEGARGMLVCRDI